MSPPISDLQRVRLDQQLQPVRSALASLRRPRGGWVRAIRTALGMTVGQLAQRAGISQPSVSQLEKSEAEGRIQLDTLERIADALDCELVYALVPRRPLSDVVAERRRKVALQRYLRAAHSMALENQLDESSNTVREAKIDAIVSDIRPNELWRDE
ncbi:MAG: mobile mystery protein A [Rhodanobacteraceae bacterium]